MNDGNKNKSRTKVYIDGANMFYTQKKLGWFFDWKEIKIFLNERYLVGEFRYYTGVKKDDEKMASYLKYLDAIGFTVITKPIKVIKVEKEHPMRQLHNYTEIYKSNFDVEMTADMSFDRNNINEFILFSGDSDFEYLVKRLQDVGKKVFVYSSRKTLSWELKLAASRYVYLEDNKKIFGRK